MMISSINPSGVHVSGSGVWATWEHGDGPVNSGFTGGSGCALLDSVPKQHPVQVTQLSYCCKVSFSQLYSRQGGE